MMNSKCNLPIDFRRVDVEAADESDKIGDHDTFAELVNDAHSREGTGADPHAIGIFAAVTYDVNTRTTSWRLDSCLTLSHRWFELARHLGNRRPLGQHLQTLAQDLAAFL